MRKALVVGINNYRVDAITNLRNAANDAANLMAFLKSELPPKLRFDVTYLVDPSAFDLNDNLDRLGEELQAAEAAGERNLFFFYFAGHGLSFPNGTRLLLCNDAPKGVLNGGSTNGGIAPETLQNFARDLPKTDIAFCYDVCRTALGGRAAADVCDMKGFRDVVSWTPKAGAANWTAAPARRWSLSSCEDGQKASDDGSFMRAFLQTMRDALRAGRGIELGERLAKTLEKALAPENASDFAQTPVAEGRPIWLVPVPGAKSEESGGDDGGFVVPDDPNKIEVEEYAIDDIRVDVETVELADAAAPDLEGKTVLPPVSEEIRRLRAEIPGIDAALQKIIDETSSALIPAREAIRRATRQREAIERRRNEIWENLAEPAREPLQSALQANPSASPISLVELKPNGMKMEDFVRFVVAEQKRLRAQAVEEQTKEQYREKRDATKLELENRKKEAQGQLVAAIDAFCNEVVDKILATCGGYYGSDVDAPVPFEELMPKVPVLEKYSLGWTDVELWKKAEERWNNARPCVVEERKRRLKKEKAEELRLPLLRFFKAFLEYFLAPFLIGEALIFGFVALTFVFSWASGELNTEAAEGKFWFLVLALQIFMVLWFVSLLGRLFTDS